MDRETMEKPVQMLESVAENYISAAEKICAFIPDPAEQSKHLEDLRKLALDHEKLCREYDLQSKAVKFVSQKLKDIRDLEIDEEYNRNFNGHKEEMKSDEEIRVESDLCKALEETIKNKKKT